MEFSLSNIKYSAAASRETSFFSAILLSNNEKIAEVFNEGNGGNTIINALPGKEEKLKAAEQYTRTLPKTTLGNFTFDTDLELIVDKLLDDWLSEKEKKNGEKKIQKNCEKYICWGVPGANNYKMRGWNGYTLTQVLEKSPESVKKLLEQIKLVMTDGEVILNKNINHLL